MFEYRLAAPGLVQYEVADGKMLPEEVGEMAAPCMKLRCFVEELWW